VWRLNYGRIINSYGEPKAYKMNYTKLNKDDNLFGYFVETVISDVKVALTYAVSCREFS